MHVVVVESPAKSKTIHKYLGDQYKILASYGHVRDLPEKDGSVDPERDFAMDYEVLSAQKKHVDEIAEAVGRADSLILATDPDREGEAISWHVLEALRERNVLGHALPVSRVVFNSITKSAILDAMSRPRQIDMNLVNAQQARRALDYLVGFKISPILWTRLPSTKSAGRVQSIALRLICDRESEIEAFVSREYWSITATYRKGSDDGQAPFPARLIQLDGEKLDKFAIVKEAEANGIVDRLRPLSYVVSKIERKEVRDNPAPPFITSTLQQEASRKLGLGAKETMGIAQRLYESGWITYMRTDGVEVAPEAVQATRRLIESLYGPNYRPQNPRIYRSKAANAQEAHEAIRPTDLTRTPKETTGLEKDQARLYELIWKRMVASQMESAIYDRVAVEINDQEKIATFRANGSTLKFEGYIKVYREDLDDTEDDRADKKLPPLTEGEALSLIEITPQQHFTEPPPRYTEASLVKKLEELGIGRPSTYAAIIDKIKKRDYVRLESKRFFPETRGRVLTAFLTHFFERYIQYEFTAGLEEELDKVSDGKHDWKALLREFWTDFGAAIQRADSLKITEVLDKLNIVLGNLLFPTSGADDERTLEQRRTCPRCCDGQLSLKVSSKSATKGFFIGCSNYPECKYTRNVETNGDVGALAEPIPLGHSQDGQPVSVRKGPWGVYIQLGESEDSQEKPKRISVPKGINPQELDLQTALRYLALPRDLGPHPETGEPVKAGIGRYGPYVVHQKTYVNLKDDDVTTVGIDRALELLASKPKGRSVEPIRVLGNHPEDNKEVAVFDGKFGLYVKHGKTNSSIPGDREVESIQLEEAIVWLNEAATRKSKKAPRTKAKTAKSTKATKTTKSTKTKSPKTKSPRKKSGS